ncbi:hypothetical protein FACS189421_12730 [Bacteroidia bacterium]|nr:hypothetical protein FACS189421_12730 [Bacteroidia bacterium]GHT06907.1 hypothetical protein FACS189423_11740 [Bacteroidia bacterium]GHT52863.1 hypothetical protein FACS189440_22310 [Bacteroidia bacterium]
MLNPAELWDKYLRKKQTYQELAEEYGCSAKTIQRRLDEYSVQLNERFPTVANVVMDTTYFGRNFGVMCFKDSISKTLLYKQYVRFETNTLYFNGIQTIRSKGIEIQSIICDGRKGLFGLFGDVPVQMCQYHQQAIIRRYLTRNPKLQAGKELLELSKKLSKLSEKQFIMLFEEWENRWLSFAKERTKNEATGKTHYTHKKLHSAWRSIKNNLPYLFVFEHYKEFNMPNTTNDLEGSFSALKKRLNNHNGLTVERKKKFIDGFFKA